MILLSILLACNGEAPEVRPSTQKVEALEATNADLQAKLTAEQAKAAGLEKQLADERGKVADYAKRAQAANAELFDLQIVAETYVARSDKRGDTLVVCLLSEGEGEGAVRVGEAVLLVPGDGAGLITGEQAVTFGDKVFTDPKQKDCDGYPVVYAADGTPSITWN